MKDLAYIVLLAFLTICSGYLLPYWWIIAFVAFVVAMAFKESMLKSAAFSFFTVGIVWFASAFLIDSANDSILSSRIGELFGIGSIGIMIVTAILGGIIAMLGGLTGASLNKVLES